MAAGGKLTATARRRGLITVLADTFLVWCGFNMVIPMISVHYVDRLGWAAVLIGIVLAVRQLLQQGLTPLSGIAADRIGVKGLICTGLLIRAGGFVLLAQAHTFLVLMLACGLAGLGGSLFDSPKSAAIAALTEPAERSRYYSLIAVVGGLGVTLGTQLGAALLGVDFSLVALIAAGCFVADFFVTLIFLPPVRVATGQGSAVSGVRLVLHDRPFLIFIALLMGFWFLWVQLTISLPLAARDVSGSDSIINWMYGINSVMSIALAYPLIRAAERRFRPLTVLIVGLAIMAVGLGSISLAHSIPGLLACVAVLSLGMLLANPSQQTVTAALANPDALGSYFGIASLALAFGGGLGNLCGGLLYDIGRQSHFSALPWMSFSVVGAASVLGLWVMARHHRGSTQPVGAPVRSESAEPAASAGLVS